jgi:hypothetical protein
MQSRFRGLILGLVSDTGEDLPTSQTEKVHVDELLEHHHAQSIEKLPANVHTVIGVFE